MSEQAIGLQGFYKVRVRQAGRIVEERPLAPNLILDQGLDQIATTRIADLFVYAACGTDNTPVKDTPSATATWNTTVLTASAATWANTDIGKLVLFATGQQCYITGFTDSTHVTVDRSNTIPAATSFVMYRTAQVKLNAEIARTNNYSQNAGDNSTTKNGAVVTMQRTYLFAVETGAGHTYYELGFSHGAVMGSADIFARVVLSPGVTVAGPSGLNPGQQLEVVYQLVIGFAPSSQGALPPTQGITGLPRVYPMYQIVPTVAGFEITVNSFVPFFVGDRVVISGTSTAYDSAAGTYYIIAAITQGPSATLVDINGTSHGTVGPGSPSVGNLTNYINLVQVAQDYGIATVANSGVTTVGPGQVLSGEPSQLGQIWAADAPLNAVAPIGSSTPQASYVTAPYAIGAYTGKSFQITKGGSFPSGTSFNFQAFDWGFVIPNQIRFYGSIAVSAKPNKPAKP